MGAVLETSTIRVAVLGNPNTGKSTLFNALTSSAQRTGNYPGVTVERRTGRFQFDGKCVELIDLPGTYSLAPRSPDELITLQVLLGQSVDKQPPDLILCVADASNLERNLFLVSQLMDLHLPLVVALNMTDLAARHGWEIDIPRLEHLLGVPVVPIQAHKGINLEGLKRAIINVVNQPPRVPHDPFSRQLSQRIMRLDRACPDDCPLKRFVVTRLLFDADGLMASRLRGLVGPEVTRQLQTEQQELRAETDVTLVEEESRSRFAWIKAHSQLFLRRRVGRRRSWSARFDEWLTHPILGLACAVIVLTVVFQVVFQVAEPASWLIDWGKAALATGVNRLLPEGALQSLLVNGLIAGVGSVLVFVPQIMLLFLMIGWLEDSGYLARAAYLSDRYLSRVGLSGLSVIPLLSSFACAIPGIMAARVINHPRDRLVTILIAPLMSCSARLPIYVLMIAVFVPPHRYLGGVLGLQGLCMLGMYMVGAVAAIAVAWVLKHTILRGPSSSFVMELPTYKWPQWSVIWRRMWEGGKSFVQGAGTTIVVVTILVWAAGYFPRSSQTIPLEWHLELMDRETRLASDEPLTAEERAELEASINAIHGRIAAAYLESSFLGRFGHWIEPVVRPLGWDWRIGSAVVASFPAREVIVSTMGIIFGLGEEVDEDSDSLRDSIAAAKWGGSDRPLFTLPIALGLMVFFALCAQCASTLAVMRRETQSWRWPLFAFSYMTALAYAGAWVTVRLSEWMLA